MYIYEVCFVLIVYFHAGSPKSYQNRIRYLDKKYCRSIVIMFFYRVYGMFYVHLKV